MKGKVLLFLALLAMAESSTINAMEIFKGKLISHKEFNTGKSKASFKDIKLDATKEFDKLKLMNVFPQEDNLDRVYVKDRVSYTEGWVGEDTTISGKAYTFISNNTEYTQTYDILTIICATFGDHDYTCGYNNDQITLDPQGFAFAGRMPSLTVSYDNAGSYYSAVVTKVQRNNQDTKFSSYDLGHVEIYDEKK